MKINVLDVPFDNVTLDEAVTKGYKLCKSDKCSYVVTPNPEIVMEARNNPSLMSALKEADMVLPDGIGIIYSAKILGTPLIERVPGIDFATSLLKKLSAENGSVYLLGAKEGVAVDAASKMKEMFPGLVIAGTHNGYFDDDKDIIEDINKLHPDFLFVCLGFPKQEIWMNKNKDILNVGIMAGLGGCLDVFAGNVDRAPDRMQKMGLEWLYRLYREPSRINRMIKLPKILGYSLIERIK